MPPFDKVTSQPDFESFDEFEQEQAEGIQACSVDEATPVESSNSFSISHKNPELDQIMLSTELMNVGHNELSVRAIDDSFLQAQEALIGHFADKLSGLPKELQDTVLASLDLQSKYQPSFPLYAQIVKSSLS